MKLHNYASLCLGQWLRDEKFNVEIAACCGWIYGKETARELNFAFYSTITLYNVYHDLVPSPSRRYISARSKQLSPRSPSRLSVIDLNPAALALCFFALLSHSFLPISLLFSARSHNDLVKKYSDRRPSWHKWFIYLLLCSFGSNFTSLVDNRVHCERFL